jgi:hypothetical protein
VVDTGTSFAARYTQGLLGCPDAYQLPIATVDAGRGVAAPPNHRHVRA